MEETLLQNTLPSASPLEAGRFQIVVLASVLAAGSITATLMADFPGSGGGASHPTELEDCSDVLDDRVVADVGTLTGHVRASQLEELLALLGVGASVSHGDD